MTTSIPIVEEHGDIPGIGFFRAFALTTANQLSERLNTETSIYWEWDDDDQLLIGMVIYLIEVDNVRAIMGRIAVCENGILCSLGQAEKENALDDTWVVNSFTAYNEVDGTKITSEFIDNICEMTEYCLKNWEDLDLC